MEPRMMQKLHQLTSSEVPRAAKILAQVFKDDPVFSLFFQSRSDQLTYGHLFYEFLLRFGLQTGEVYAFSPKLEGVIIWIMENPPIAQMEDIIQSGILTIWDKIDSDTILQFTRFTSQIRRKYLRNIAWYLQLIAVDPLYQHRGIGKALIKPKLEQCDVDQQYCYLETQNQLNVKYYQTFGFQVVESLILPSTNVQLWCMLRKPTSPSLSSNFKKDV